MVTDSMDAANEDQIPTAGDTPADSSVPDTGVAASPQGQRSGRGKGKRAGANQEPGKTEIVLRRFQACGRCSYFVADCQNHLGRDVVRLAIEEGPAEWLELDWAEVLRRLARQSYIASDDVYYFYYDGTCPECQRRYTYLSEPHEDEQPMFRLQY